jgi:hypothetical protein
MFASRILAAILAVLLAVGCLASQRAPSTALHVAALAGAGSRDAVDSEAPDAHLRYGLLSITVNWPARGVSMIPNVTNTLGVVVSDKDGNKLATVVVPRPAGALKLTTTVKIRIANNLSITVYAYLEGNPVVGTTPFVARGDASGFSVFPSKNTLVKVTLAPADVPAITRILPDAAKVGDTVTIEGANLAGFQGVLPAIAFNGATASALTPLSDTKLEAKVPQGATTGRVTASIFDMPSTSNAQYWIGGGIAVTLPGQASQESGVTLPSGLVYYGKSAKLDALVAWLFAPGEDLAGQPAAPPALLWKSSNAAAGPLSQAGILASAAKRATTSITAEVGTLQSAPVTVDVVGVDGVNLDKPGATIYGVLKDFSPSPSFAGLTSVKFRAAATTTLPFNGGVLWTVDSSEVVQLSAVSTESATVLPRPDGLPGTVTLTATCRDDTRIKATASITVKNDGNVNLEVD